MVKQKKLVLLSQNRHQGNSGVFHSHEDPRQVSFWRKYIFATDHKIIGLQYGITGLFPFYLVFV